MKSLYEVLHVDLAQEYTKARKTALVSELGLTPDLENQVKDAIASMDIPEDDDRYQVIQRLGHAAGADLLTLGKVQPENMLAMAALPPEDFQAAVKVATGSARKWNQLTVEAEKELNEETVNTTL